MAAIHANGIEIEYTENGPRDGPVILLIMGLGMQLIAWPDVFCEGLAGRGFRVVRFDNRDAGLSTKMSSARSLPLAALMAAAFIGLRIRPPYTLRDMASDALGLMDGLGIDRAHIVGASMGGMIAQIIAAEHPERVKSLVSLMSTSGNPALPGPEPMVLRALLRPRPRHNAERAIRQTMELFRLIGSPGYPTTDTELRAKVERAFRRSDYPKGFARQLLAVQAAGSRAPLLRRIRAPALVLHGADDPLVPKAGGEDTAANISGARLRIIPGMGHDVPTALAPLLVSEIAEHCLNAERQASYENAARQAGSAS